MYFRKSLIYWRTISLPSSRSKSKSSKKPEEACDKLNYWLLDLLFGPEDGGDMFL
jgi:hypothetical protein